MENYQKIGETSTEQRIGNVPPSSYAEGSTLLKTTEPAVVQPGSSLASGMRASDVSSSSFSSSPATTATNVPLAPPSRAVGVAHVDRSIIDKLRYPDQSNIQHYIQQNNADIDNLVQELHHLRNEYTTLGTQLRNEIGTLKTYETNTYDALTEARNSNTLAIEMMHETLAHHYIMNQLKALIDRENHLLRGKESASVGAVRLRDRYSNVASENERLFERNFTRFNEGYNRLMDVAYIASTKLNELRNKQETFIRGMQEFDMNFLAKVDEEIRKRQTEAAMNKALAEESAALAAKSKAIEEASLQSSRQLAEEEAKAVQLAREAQMRAEAVAREREQLLDQSAEARRSAEFETERSAKSAAEGLAREKEAELIAQEEEKTRSRLIGLGVLGGGTAAALAGGTALASIGRGTESMSSVSPAMAGGAMGTMGSNRDMNPFLIPFVNPMYSPLQVLWIPNGLNELQSMAMGPGPASTIARPPSTVPNYVLHVRMGSLHPKASTATTGSTKLSSFPAAVALRVTLSDAIALSDPFPLPSMVSSGSSSLVPLNVVATLPIYHQVLSDDNALSIEVVDASSMLMKGYTKVSSNALPREVQLHKAELTPNVGSTVLGQALVIISHLADGHVSKNQFQLTGTGGALIETELQMVVPQKYNYAGGSGTTGMVPLGSAVYAWMPIQNAWLFVPVPLSLLSSGTTSSSSTSSATNFGNANYPSTATSSTIMSSGSSTSGNRGIVSV